MWNSLIIVYRSLSVELSDLFYIPSSILDTVFMYVSLTILGFLCILFYLSLSLQFSVFYLPSSSQKFILFYLLLSLYFNLPSTGVECILFRPLLLISTFISRNSNYGLQSAPSQILGTPLDNCLPSNTKEFLVFAYNPSNLGTVAAYENYKGGGLLSHNSPLDFELFKVQVIKG